MSYNWGHPVATLPVTNETIRNKFCESNRILEDHARLGWRCGLGATRAWGLSRSCGVGFKSGALKADDGHTLAATKNPRSGARAPRAYTCAR
eukprot:1209497-Pleurochrysis_carterae.AAC.1